MEKYDTDPDKRVCPKCNHNFVMYHGYVGDVASNIPDDLGINGVFCHADGKTYDSKSAYYKAVKAAGMEIVGNEKLTSSPKSRDVDWHRAVKESLERKGY
jgi:hypothetical protein